MIRVFLKWALILLPVFSFAQGSKPVQIRTPNGPQILSDGNLKITTFLIIPASSVSGISAGSNVDSAGYLRYNPSSKTFQGYYGHIKGWLDLVSGSAPAITTNIIAGVTPNPITVSYTGMAHPWLIFRNSDGSNYGGAPDNTDTGSSIILSGNDDGAGHFADSFTFIIKP